jgi:hypothetical protein
VNVPFSSPFLPQTAKSIGEWVDFGVGFADVAATLPTLLRKAPQLPRILATKAANARAWLGEGVRLVTRKTTSNLDAPSSARWTAPKITSNRHGQLTNGQYILDDVGMQPHTTGSLTQGKSQFLYRVNEKQVVLDAAAYADEAGLWVGNKAKAVLGMPIGVHGQTGELTNVINIYRTNTGFVHGTPARP